MKERQINPGTRLVSLNKRNKHELTFNLNPRVVFYLLKSTLMFFSKPQKCPLIKVEKFTLPQPFYVYYTPYGIYVFYFNQPAQIPWRDMKDVLH